MLHVTGNLGGVGPSRPMFGPPNAETRHRSTAHPALKGQGAAAGKPAARPPLPRLGSEALPLFLQTFSVECVRNDQKGRLSRRFRLPPGEGRPHSCPVLPSDKTCPFSSPLTSTRPPPTARGQLYGAGHWIHGLASSPQPRGLTQGDRVCPCILLGTRPAKLQSQAGPTLSVVLNHPQLTSATVWPGMREGALLALGSPDPSKQKHVHYSPPKRS